ncbi:hypothetical protein THICB2_840002 [Thiomonas sp. CB2]|nr:hypothetical protein THICB2_840002 [Thiomonas sp. CB2]VDY06185.1 protein of unknown function [Thiomonas sp. Bio17B3]VDY10519.1 protein of unknown function [Thiomonas sp. Sup16B3]VDY14449.1 conserved protein of unknown function [Thiomonas sp. OC7]VDY16364.1 protein of unknown function [Thiomonas sp. CB2]
MRQINRLLKRRGPVKMTGPLSAYTAANRDGNPIAR